MLQRIGKIVGTTSKKIKCESDQPTLISFSMLQQPHTYFLRTDLFKIAVSDVYIFKVMTVNYENRMDVSVLEKKGKTSPVSKL